MHGQVLLQVRLPLAPPHQHTLTSSRYPVIVAIIAGALIALSVLYCVSKILCCGAKCCFCFADMARCCCCCCGGSNRGHSNPPPQNQYVSPYAHSNPHNPGKSGYVNPSAYESGFGAGGVGYNGQGQYRSQPPPKYGYAQFDTPTTQPAGKTGYRGATASNGDALPAMPSWDDARTHKIEEQGGDVEMGKVGGASQGDLPKFETDDYRYGRGDSAHGEGMATGAAAVGAVGLAQTGAGRYEDTYGRSNSYGQGAGQHGYGQDGQGYDRPNQGYGGDNHGYGQTNQAYAQGGQSYAQQDHGYDQQDHAYNEPSYATNHYGQSESTTAVNSAYGQTSPTRTQPVSPTRSTQQPYQSYQSYQPVSQQTGGQGQGYQAYPGQASYQPSTPSAGQGQAGYGSPPASEAGGVGRKPVQGSWRDL